MLSKEFFYSSTDYGDEDVFEYIVNWLDYDFTIDDWKHKFFASKKEAKQFARKHKSNIKPNPYIVKKITVKSSFKKDVKVEYCKIKFKTLYGRNSYRKIIRY